MADKEFIRGAVTGALCAAAVTIGAGAGLWLANMPAGDTALADRKTRFKLEALEKIIDDRYLEEKDEEKLREGLYTGLLYGLGDPYSRYYTAKEYEKEVSGNEGEYSGIGVVITDNSEGGVRVAVCYEGSPAEKAGIREGDVISAVDGTDITEMEVSEVSALIKRDGEGSAVLTVHREDAEEPLEITVQISNVELPTVFHEMLEDSVGYLRISEFTLVTPRQFQEAFSDMESRGMEKLVVDLRYNPGGVYSAVCDVLRQILPEGLIVYTEDKYGNRQEETCEGKTPLSIPMAVLVNEESASASEVFAGAVKDYGIGTLVGTTTYGKGIVQSLHKLRDGSAVKLTTSKYFTPNGSNIHKVGIKPDVEVKLDTSLLNKDEITHEDDNQLQEALRVLGAK